MRVGTRWVASLRLMDGHVVSWSVHHELLRRYHDGAPGLGISVAEKAALDSHHR